VEDRDEDLVHIGFDLWYVENGIKFMIRENRDSTYPPHYGPEGYSEEYIFSAPSPESSLYYRVNAVDMAGHRLDTGDVWWNKNGAAVIEDDAQETRSPDSQDAARHNSFFGGPWVGNFLLLIVIGGLPALLGIIFWLRRPGRRVSLNNRIEE
jgi:hypothetical protein